MKKITNSDDGNNDSTHDTVVETWLHILNVDSHDDILRTRAQLRSMTSNTTLPSEAVLEASNRYLTPKDDDEKHVPLPFQHGRKRVWMIAQAT